jgi:hypothetical protein
MRGKKNKRGLSPLKLPRKESQREAKPLLINYFPIPLLREGGRRVPRKIEDFSGC